MSKKSVGVTEETYKKLISVKSMMGYEKGEIVTASDAVEKLLLDSTLVADYKRYQKLGGERPLAEYEEYWLQGQMEKMETEAKSPQLAREAVKKRGKKK